MLLLAGLGLVFLGLIFDAINLSRSLRLARTGVGKSTIPLFPALLYIGGVRLGVGHFVSFPFALLTCSLLVLHFVCVDFAARAMYPMRIGGSNRNR